MDLSPFSFMHFDDSHTLSADKRQNEKEMLTLLNISFKVIPKVIKRVDSVGSAIKYFNIL